MLDVYEQESCDGVITTYWIEEGFISGAVHVKATRLAPSTRGWRPTMLS